MKKITLLISVFIGLFQAQLYGQDLVSHIPDDAYSVVSLKTDHIFELIDIAEFDESVIGQKLLDVFERADGSSIQSVEDVGISMHSAMYFYTRQTDSIWYHIILLPLSDVQRFASNFSGEVVQEENGVYTVQPHSDASKSQIHWNAQMAVISFGSLNDAFFESEAVARNYGINNGTDAYTQEEVITEKPGITGPKIQMAPAAPVVQDTVVVLEQTHPDSVSDTVTYDTITDTAEAPENVDYNDYYADDYTSAYQENKLKKDSLTYAWVAREADKVLSQAPEHTILENASFVKSQHKDAVVTAWLKDLGLLYDELYMSLLIGKTFPSVYMGFGSMQAGLYINGNELRVKSAIELKGEMARAYSRIYNRKINRKFSKYLDSESALAFFGYGIDMQAYMEELPRMGSKIYGSMAGGYEEEFRLGADIVSLLLDEEAVAKTIKGDALFVLNGIHQKDVKYTDYEYDDDYNVTEVEKTKKETVPDFLLMFSSDNEALYHRLLDYAVHKGFGTLEDQVYALSFPKMPAELFWTYRDGIVFIGTTQDQLEKIAYNQVGRGASSFHKKLLRRNIMVGYFNTQLALDQISKSELASLEDEIPIRRLFGHVGNFYFKSGRAKKDMFSGEFVAHTSEEFPNVLKYVLWLADQTIKQ